MKDAAIQRQHDAHESAAASLRPQRDERPPRNERSCVGCGQREERDAIERGDLVRLIISPSGEVAVDARGGGFGRGAYVHPRPQCLERAVQRGLSRAARARVDTLVADPRETEGEEAASTALNARALAEAIEHAMDRRIEGLLGAALRSKNVAIGADAVTEACRRGEAHLVVVACDAAAAADLTEVRRAVAEGRAIAWGTKERLGAITAPPSRRLAPDEAKPEAQDEAQIEAQIEAQVMSAGVGVLAILSSSIAEALGRAALVAGSVTQSVQTSQRASVSAPQPGKQGKRGDESSRSAGQSPHRIPGNGDSSKTSACAPVAKGGQQRSPSEGEAARNSRARRSPGDRKRGAPTDKQRASGDAARANRTSPSRGWHREREGVTRRGERKAKDYAGERHSDG